MGQLRCEPCHFTMSTFYEGASSRASCACREGSFLDRKAKSCMQCPYGYVCPSGNFTIPSVLPGYWAPVLESVNDLSLYRL
jgi:hypothetical protein